MFGIKGGLGYEVLESEGTANTAFRTPLGTNHAFNGWADLFLTTPANGLEDMYFSLGYDHKSRNKYLHNISVLFTYHDFQAENGGGDYGEEFDVLVRKQINKNWSFGVKYANFSADSASAFNDREMISTWLGVKLSQ
jgi:hypothetical protein